MSSGWTESAKYSRGDIVFVRPPQTQEEWDLYDNTGYWCFPCEVTEVTSVRHIYKLKLYYKPDPNTLASTNPIIFKVHEDQLRYPWEAPKTYGIDIDDKVIPPGWKKKGVGVPAAGEYFLTGAVDAHTSRVAQAKPENSYSSCVRVLVEPLGDVVTPPAWLPKISTLTRDGNGTHILWSWKHGMPSRTEFAVDPQFDVNTQKWKCSSEYDKIWIRIADPKVFSDERPAELCKVHGNN